MTRVKICGICDVWGARAAVSAGADLIGFHFCSSLRRVEPEAVRAILDALDRRPDVVGVFIDQPPEEVRQVADYTGLDWVQLHGSERAGFPAVRPLIKALKVRDGELPDAEPWPDPILLDSWSADQRGGTGRSWDWAVARRLLAERKVFLAGGLNPASVASAVRGQRPYGVDVSSGVESEPRVKDPEKILAFVKMVRVAESSGE